MLIDADVLDERAYDRDDVVLLMRTAYELGFCDAHAQPLEFTIKNVSEEMEADWQGLLTRAKQEAYAVLAPIFHPLPTVKPK
jgi:hypothetical protein